MSKLIYGIAVALVLGTTGAIAQPENVNNNNCNGRGSCSESGNGNGNGPITNDLSNKQHQAQGQVQGQSQESTNVNYNSNDSTAVSDSNSSASSDSSATGVGFGGSSTVGVAVKTGPTVSGSFSNASGGEGGHGGDAHARGGNASASGGDANSRSYSEGGSVGDTTAVAGPSVSGASVGDTTTGDVRSSNAVGVSIADNSSYSVEYQEASARAANVYTAVCQNGGSAQGVMGGFGVTNQDVVCEHLKIASFMREAYVWELEYGHSAQCAGPMDIDHKYNEAEWADTCFSDKAVEYYKAYHEHMTEAIQAMEAYEEAGLMDKIAGALVRPLALIGALIWLI